MLIVPQLSRHVLEFSPVNERVASLHLRVEDRSLTVVSAYGPNSSVDYPAFLEALGGVLESAHNGDSIVLLGVFCYWTSSHILSIMNTTFKHKGVHMCTWHQDALGWRSMINFVVRMSWTLRRRERLSTAHHLVVNQIHWQGRKLDRPGRPKRTVRVCWERLVEPSVREVFNSHLQESFDQSECSPHPLLTRLFGAVAVRSPVPVVAAIPEHGGGLRK